VLVPAVPATCALKLPTVSNGGRTQMLDSPLHFIAARFSLLLLRENGSHI
jgi:hypothetical protein